MELAKARNRETDPNNKKWRQFWQFLTHAKLSWGWIFLTLAVTIAYYSVVSKLPGSTAGLFSGNFSNAAIMGVVINYSSLLGLKVLVSVLMLLAEARSVRSVRQMIWKRMMDIENSYYDKNSASGLLSAVTSDTENTLSSFISMVVTIPGLLTYLAQALPQINAYSPKLMFSVFVLIPVYILYAVFMGRWQYKVSSRIQMRIGGLTGYLAERIRNLTLIKAFVTEPQEEEKGLAASGKLYKANVEFAGANGVMVMYTMFTEAVGVLIAVLWGCKLLRDGEIDLTAWLAFFLYVPTINMVFRQLTNIWANLKEVQGRAARLGALITAPQEQMNTEASPDIPTGDIVLDQVSFSYQEGTPLLDKVSVTIPAGKVTAIVGPTGSGKTTVLRLIERLYAPDKGSITVGGKDIRELNLSAWRSHLSYVTQGAELFSGTFRQALTYGIHRDVTEKELIEAARLADIYDFIAEKPGQFDAKLDIWGGAMSGGQRQRLVIARELLKNADVLILDEPTSALDAETAAALSDTFMTRFAGKTVITVTHELNYIASADQIIVLRAGKVEGIGAHQALMASCPTYRALVEEQSYQEVMAR